MFRPTRADWPMFLLTAFACGGLACGPAPGPAPEEPVEALQASPQPPPDPSPTPVLLRDPQAPATLVQPGRALDYRHPYQFAEDWFSHNIPLWVGLFEGHAARPGLRYLEIGLWEGRSFLWMLDHILTHPSSRATGIDIELSDRLRQNLELSGAAGRVTLIEGASQVALRKLPAASQDIVYIDGSHTAPDVLEDMVLCWRLLSPGGLMILDDYRWKGFRDPERPALPDELLPRLAIDAFVSANRSYVEVVLDGYQMVLRKRTLGCPDGDAKCSSLGDYSYDWLAQALYGGEGLVALSAEERELVEALIRAKQGDARSLALDPALADSASLRALRERLGLSLGPE